MSQHLLYFRADWCVGCNRMGPSMDDLAQEFDVRKVDADEEPDLLKHFGVLSLPTVVLVRDGAVASRAVGAMPKARLVKELGLG